LILVSGFVIRVSCRGLRNRPIAIILAFPSPKRYIRIVQAVAPLVYSRCTERQRCSPLARVLALVIAGLCGAVLVTAARLTPNRQGFGTHTALGLQACAWFAQTGIPCPACGMTTSFACFVRGQLLHSLYVQPMGFVLAALTCCTVWGAIYIAGTGRPIYRLLWVIPSRYYLLPLISWGVVAWAWKIFIHVHGIDGF
jgi:uncharacterized membrane protein YdcZ (DUF606 family)